MYPDATITYLIKKTDQWLQKELSLSETIKSDIEKLKTKLLDARAFLRDMDGQRKQDNQLQEYIQQLRVATSDIEIVLDKHAYRNAQKNAPWHAVTTRIGRHSIANSIKASQSHLENIKDMKPAHQGVAAHHSASTSNASLSVPEVEILGVEEPKEKLLTWARARVDQRTHKVMFVVGMGGSGKSALVKWVYEQLKKNFDYSVWLAVSEFENGQQLLSHMVSNTTGQSPIPYHTHMDLITKLNYDLLNKKYLIVLDDLWNKKIWESVKQALPTDNYSRVIITTRRGDIASSYHVDVYKVQALPLEKARDLFYIKAFSESGTDPSEEGLNESSEKLLKECEGLPLGIIEIGKLVSTKPKSESELTKLNGSLQAELAMPKGKLSNITQVLMLSYNDLPHHLKCCFLYMSIFPPYHSVKRRMLIRLWIAEGYIEEVVGKTLEDIGEDCLEELIERNLIQASELYIDGRARTCRLHNLMHKIALSIPVAENFLVKGKKIRRWAIDEDGIDKSGKELDLAHTILITSGKKLNIPAGIISSMKLLKILHLDHANVDALPSGIEKLLLLKYLSLCHTRIKLIPETIGRLQHLETLNLKETLVTTLPKSSEKLQKLRYLLVYKTATQGQVQGLDAPAGISMLANLQKLSFVRADTNHKLLQELQKLTQLRKLGIIDLRRSNGPVLCKTIQMLRNLHSLNMVSLDREEELNIQEINNPPSLLARLYLKGRLEKMPDWISKLHDLIRIRLQWSRLTQQSNPITILGQLPNLLELQLLDAYTGNQLDFEAGTFNKLKILEFEQLEELKMIIIEERALPCLQTLIIRKCPKLMQIPGIDNIIQLKELYLRDLPPDFVDPLRRNGQMRHLVQHIQKIYSRHGCELEWEEL